jgi:hypothetical protein
MDSLLLCQVCVKETFDVHAREVAKGTPDDKIMVPEPRFVKTARIVLVNNMPVMQLVCLEHFNHTENASGLAIA